MKDEYNFSARDNPSHTSFINVAQLVPRPIGPGELAHLRAIWWRQAAMGHRLPAELGVIVIEGWRV